jgi:hypothetical protein
MQDDLQLDLKARTEAYYEEARIAFWTGQDVAKLEKSLADVLELIARTVDEQSSFLKDMQNRFCIPTGKAAANRTTLDKARTDRDRLRKELEVAVALHEAVQRRVTKLFNEVQELMGL